MTPDGWTDADPTVCPKCGRDSCDDPAHLPPDRQSALTASTRRPRLTIQCARDLIHLPRPIEIIEGFAWSGCLTVLVSESGIGKTFVLFDAAAAVSDDVSWHGREVRPGSVLYLSFEGDALGVRLRALTEIGHRLEHLYVVRASDPISPRLTRDGEERSVGEITVVAALEGLVHELDTTKRPPITLLVIDTVRASLSGSEDSSEHVAAYQRAVRRIMAYVPRAATVLAHHAGWQDSETQKKRERGSSAWRGNSDAVLFLEAGSSDSTREGEVPLTLRALKVRDAERPAPLHLIRRRIELAEGAGADLRRGPVTSCVIDHDRRTREDREAEAMATADRQRHEIDRQTLRAILEHPDEATSQNALRLLVGMRKDAVSDAVARLLHHGWVRLPSRQRQPYTVTDAGRQALELDGVGE
jgi:hypothetical protein